MKPYATLCSSLAAAVLCPAVTAAVETGITNVGGERQLLVDHFEYQGSRRNNILFRQIGTGEHRSRVHGTGVFVDPTAPAEARYKAVSQGIWQGPTPPQRIAGMVSPDGLTWTRLPTPICDLFADSQYSGLWDSRLGTYVLYGRVVGNIGRTESADFARFSPLELVLAADPQDPPNSNLYNAAVTKVPGVTNVYLLLPSLFSFQFVTAAP